MACNFLTALVYMYASKDNRRPALTVCYSKAHYICWTAVWLTLTSVSGRQRGRKSVRARVVCRHESVMPVFHRHFLIRTTSSSLQLPLQSLASSAFSEHLMLCEVKTISSSVHTSGVKYISNSAVYNIIMCLSVKTHTSHLPSGPWVYKQSHYTNAWWSLWFFCHLQFQ